MTAVGRKAADKGNAAAQYNLGCSYAKGDGVPEDVVVAYQWLTLAEKGGEAQASQRKDRLGIKMTAAQVEQALKLVREFTPVTTSTHNESTFRSVSPEGQGRWR